MNLWYDIEKWILFPKKSCNYFFSNKITPNLTCHPMQGQTEPKLYPGSAIWKGDLKLNLEPKWFSRCGLENSMLVLRATKWTTRKHAKGKGQNLGVLRDSTWISCIPFKETIQVPGLWWGKTWNHNTSKKSCDWFFLYVLGSKFTAHPSKVSRNRQKNWHWREKTQVTWKDNTHSSKLRDGKNNEPSKIEDGELAGALIPSYPVVVSKWWFSTRNDPPEEFRHVQTLRPISCPGSPYLWDDTSCHIRFLFE